LFKPLLEARQEARAKKNVKDFVGFLEYGELCFLLSRFTDPDIVEK
jgi:hypothetical protein